MSFSVLEAASEAPDRPALLWDDQVLTFAELAREVRGYLPALASLAPDDRVSITPRLDRDSVVRLLAAIEAGRGIVLLHPRWSEVERERALRLTTPALDLATIRSSSSPPRLETPEPRSPLALVFTSGTTGAPRAAVLSRGALLAAADASAAVLGWQDDDRWLLAMPLAHVGGLSIVLRCLHARRTVVLHRGPIEAAALHRSITEHRVTLASLVPTMLRRMLEADGGALPSLRALLLGGAACPPPLLARAIDRGLKIRTTYGLTEMGAQVATLRSPAIDDDPGVGPPLPGVELELEGTRIRVRGPSLFDGFWGEPSPLDARGFYDTGDHGRLDERGHLHLLGRRSDLIVSGGENVYPAEVEAALEAIEGIEAACVFGLPDPEWGEVVCAACVAPHPPTRAALEEGLAPLSRFKRPRRLAWVESLVIGPSGKVDRAASAAAARPNLQSFQ